MNRRLASVLLVVVVAPLAACGSDGGSNPGSGAQGAAVDTAPSEASSPGTASPGTASQGEQRFPDVIDAVATKDGDTWTFDVTISSPYDTAERYADAWRVLAPDGTELAVRELDHDHAAEQPFTRSLAGVEIPDGIDTVTIEGRDLANGYGGETLDVDL